MTTKRRKETGRTWIACRNCGIAQLLSKPTQAKPVGKELELAAAQFMDRHHGHVLTTLCSETDAPFVSDRPIWDPRARVSFQATDGQRDYVVTAERASIDEERTYRFEEGRLPATQVVLELVETDFQRALQAEFGGFAEPALLRRIEQTVKTLPTEIEPGALQEAVDDPEDPRVQYADWPEAARAKLVELGRNLLPPSLRAKWEDFVREHAVAQGALALKKRHQIPIAHQGETLPAPL